MRRIELPSEALAKELQKHLQQRRYTIGERESATIHFPENMRSSEWSSLRGTVEKWASGRQLDISESMKLESPKPVKEDNKGSEALTEKQAELKKKLAKLSPQMAEERYNYLQNKPIGELTDEEYDERLELAQRNFKKERKQLSQ